MQKLIKRPNYLEQLIENKDIDLVKIITGIRRCGKSTLLDLFHNYLLEMRINEENIIHINFESLKYKDIKTYIDLYDYISSKIKNSNKTYLIFDELQVVEHWEKAVESFRLDFNCDIYITGSNAYMLSSEFSTLISGRYIEIKMLPLSFKEFLDFYNFDKMISIEEKFQKYIQIGGMPVLHEFQNIENNIPRINQALEGIYSTIILKDIVQRNRQIDQVILNKIIMFVCSNIGNITSTNNIANVLSNEKELDEAKNNVANSTINKYIKMLQDTFFVYSVSRYDIKGKALLKTLEKNYIIDMGFRHLLLGYRNIDRGNILENIVFLELLRRDYNVYIGKWKQTEIDFIAEKPNEKIYIQVTESLMNENTRNRELQSLIKIEDNYEKIVLSMDRDFEKSYDGIKVINIIDWLLEFK
ncbi:ATP-binding protein [Oceanivirga salmonicida]|uniref:ATP-binding protein n=1 Tax=Oceanivirga salmonicida TaxID=1769291 RepID=UPI0008354675|nr:ATP-binding protein [Oceanivirga salmonicida]